LNEPNLASRESLRRARRAGLRMTILVGSSLHRVVEFFHPVLRLEDFAGLGAVGGADDAVLLHEVN